MNIEIKKQYDLVDYEASVKFMQHRVNEISNNLQKELIWFLTHDHIYTKGTSANENEILVSDVDIPIFHIEAKRHKRCNIKAALKQAVEDANVNGKIPVAITKDDREEILCTMRLDDWIHLFNAYIDNLD